MFNEYRKIHVGGGCRQNTTRHHGEIHSDYGAVGIWSGWLFSANTDCNATLEMWVNGGHWDNFHWQVFNAPVNLAAGRPASQSTTDFGGYPARATDGNTDGNWVNNSVTHTSYQSQPYWQVDLGFTQSIGGVVLFNRTDCCSERLADFDIKVSYDGVDWNTVLSEHGPTGARTEFALASPQGRYLRVQLRGTNYLSLAEVEVYAP
jgi:F5/8 type C domain-containing protein